MKKSDIEEIIELIKKDKDLKSKFATLLESVLEDTLSLQSKIYEIVSKKSRINAATSGI